MSGLGEIKVPVLIIAFKLSPTFWNKDGSTRTKAKVCACGNSAWLAPTTFGASPGDAVKPPQRCVYGW